MLKWRRRKRRVRFFRHLFHVVLLNPVIGLKVPNGTDEKVNLAELVGNTEDFAESGCVPSNVLN